MQQVPARAAGARIRASGRWPEGWLSFALAPAAAAAIWLLAGGRPAGHAPVPSPSAAAIAPLPAVNPSGERPNPIQIALPGDPSGLQWTKLPPPGARTGEPAKSSGHPKKSPAPLGPAPQRKGQGHRPVEEDALHRLRHLRPRRAPYVLVQYRPAESRRRYHPWPLLVERPQTPPVAVAPPSPAAAPRVSVVEYVLPAVQETDSASETGNAPGPQAAQPAAMEAGFDL
jgi:hypothetical protein